MNPNTFAYTLASALAFVPLFIFYILPWAFRLFASRVIGTYVIRKTAGRRKAIYTRVEENEKKFGEQTKGKKGDSDEEWENVEAYAAGTAKDGGKEEKEWSGVVGFFHPFWYDPPRFTERKEGILIFYIVTLEVVANVSYGEQY